MSDGMWGASLEGLERLAVDLTRRADEVAQVERQVTSVLMNATFWEGDDAGQFVHEWRARHCQKLGAAASGLRSAAETVRRNAAEQRRTSAADGPAASSDASRSGASSSQGWKRTIKSGVGGRGVDSSEVEIIRLPDGTYQVRGGYSSGFELDGGDLLSLASLAHPGGKALAAVAGGLDVDMSMFGVGRSYSFNAPDAETANLLAEMLKRESNELGGIDGLTYDEVDKAVRALQDKGYDVRCVEFMRTSPSSGVSGSFSVGGVSIDGDSAMTILGHGRRPDTLVDSYSIVGAEANGEINGFSGSVGGGRSLEIERDPSGNVTSVRYAMSQSVEAGVGISTDQVLSLFNSGPNGVSSSVPGASSISNLLSAEVSVREGYVLTTSYDVNGGPALMGQIQELVGRSGGELSAESLRRVDELLQTQSLSSTEQLERVAAENSSQRLISYETQTEQTSRVSIPMN